MAKQEDETIIKVTNVTKTFRLPHEKTSSIKSALISGWRKSRTYEKQKALDDVSFEVKKGEFFGIVGRNGSGKSTLLKLLAGIYSPSKGSIEVHGTLTPFIELGVGFNPELTGRENVFLNGALLGFNRKRMQSMYKDIVEFAELDRFMDQKLKNYSSGMQVRLAFSIAIRAESDIILLDEVLAVGDVSFQKKCRDYFAEIKNTDTTVVLVTHDMKTVTDFCDKALLISDGQKRLTGNPNTIVDAYKEINASPLEDQPKTIVAAEDFIENGAKIVKKAIQDANKQQPKTVFKPNDQIEVTIDYRLETTVTDATLDIGLTSGLHELSLFSTDTHLHGQKVSGKKGETIRCKFTFENVFNGDTFYLSTSIFEEESMRVYVRDRHVLKFETDDSAVITGLTAPHHELKLSKAKGKNEAA